MTDRDTIVALSTAQGGAINVIRLSGDSAVKIASRIFHTSSGHDLASCPGYHLMYGAIKDRDNLIDEVMLSVFRSPRSYTGEDMIEISCHGSPYITQRIISLCLDHGARTAGHGEFTMRAFLNGKMDLAQAEAVADLISAEDKASHTMAVKQLRGGYSAEFIALRNDMIHLLSMLELELDFSEEDVEFADRGELKNSINSLSSHISGLCNSFELSNAFKQGIPVAIAGLPNAGKSTLLNKLANDERAMVSDLPGTTRDVIEESIAIDGVKFRFMDTAGIRATTDPLEKMGIERTHNSISKANILIVMSECGVDIASSLANVRDTIQDIRLEEGQSILVAINKCDKLDESVHSEMRDQIYSAISAFLPTGTLKAVETISAKTGYNIELVKSHLSNSVDSAVVFSDQVVVSNARHHDSLKKANASLGAALSAIDNGLPADLLVEDIKDAMHHLASITGEISTDNILHNIFANFCIGK